MGALSNFSLNNIFVSISYKSMKAIFLKCLLQRIDSIIASPILYPSCSQSISKCSKFNKYSVHYLKCFDCTNWTILFYPENSSMKTFLLDIGVSAWSIREVAYAFLINLLWKLLYRMWSQRANRHRWCWLVLLIEATIIKIDVGVTPIPSSLVDSRSAQECLRTT